MTIKIMNPGLLTTIQDLGRPGYQKDGIPVGGAMDPLALRLANLLVGNPEDEAALEMTLLGPAIRFLDDSLIAITGANLLPSINGKPVPMMRPVFIKTESELRFHPSSHGCRAYLSIAGGFQIDKVMGSKSTYPPAGLGHVITVNDILTVGEPSEIAKRLMKTLEGNGSAEAFVTTKWSVSSNVRPSNRGDVIVRVLPGPEQQLFSDAALENFFTARFKVSPQSNRMGYRLQGPVLLQKEKVEILSTPVAVGTVQVPSDGQPIILMADCQTTGGYPRIGHVIQVDLPQLAQAKPGDHVFFQPFTLDEAHRQLIEQEKMLNNIKLAIRMRCHDGQN